MQTRHWMACNFSYFSIVQTIVDCRIGTKRSLFGVSYLLPGDSSMPRPSFVRFALVGIFAFLFLISFGLPSGYSQFGRPPGGIAGRPPGMSGGMAGMPGGMAGRPPGGITGINGGITGMPGGMNGMNGVAGMNGMAGMSGGMNGIHGGIAGMPGGMGGSQTVMTWKCSRCGTLIGTGPIRPTIANCPSCGVHFIGNGNMANMMNPPPTVNAPTTTSPVQPATSPESFTSSTSGSADDDTPTPTRTSGLKRTLIIVAIIIGVVFVLGVLALIIVLTLSSSGSGPKKKRRRPAIDLDDDD